MHLHKACKNDDPEWTNNKATKETKDKYEFGDNFNNANSTEDNNSNLSLNSKNLDNILHDNTSRRFSLNSFDLNN